MGHEYIAGLGLGLARVVVGIAPVRAGLDLDFALDLGRILASEETRKNGCRSRGFGPGWDPNSQSSLHSSLLTPRATRFDQIRHKMGSAGFGCWCRRN